MLEEGLQALVVANSAISALIGTRFYPVIPPEDVTYPCATYQVISDVPDYELVGVPVAIVPVRIQIDSRSGGVSNASYGAARGVERAIRLLLAGKAKTATSDGIPCFSGALPNGTIVASIMLVNYHSGYNQDAREYVCSADYMVRYYAGT
jgi:hypothetical protein